MRNFSAHLRVGALCPLSPVLLMLHGPGLSLYQWIANALSTYTSYVCSRLELRAMRDTRIKMASVQLPIVLLTLWCKRFVTNYKALSIVNV
jgi:hypothetical protein